LFRRAILSILRNTHIVGIRTSTVIRVGVSTLAAFLGAGDLGEPIVDGRPLGETNLILMGAVPSAPRHAPRPRPVAPVDRGRAAAGPNSTLRSSTAPGISRIGPSLQTVDRCSEHLPAPSRNSDTQLESPVRPGSVRPVPDIFGPGTRRRDVEWGEACRIRAHLLAAGLVVTRGMPMPAKPTDQHR
jgi:hypothetical protein